MKHQIKNLITTLLAIVIALSCITPAFASTDSIIIKDTNALEENIEKLSKKDINTVALITEGKTNWKIVIPNKCNKELKTAINVLVKSLKGISGVDFQVIKKKELNDTNSVHCIYIGGASPVKYKVTDNVEGTYRIKITSKYISIKGEDQFASANGIYGFLEDILGVMFLTPKTTYYPKTKSVYIKKLDKFFIPATQWRDVYSYETVQNKWAAKLRLNGIETEKKAETKPVEELQYKRWGTWCHNCYDYLSPEEYFDTHPEYFSEKNGKRVTVYEGREAYLCLSNPEVYEIVRDSLKKKIEENPDKLYWDFSGNDNYALRGCECKNCKKADEAAGGTGMGTLLPFLNKLAKEFPDKYISTLAYLHTLKAPEGIKAEKNVVIKLCAMPGDQASSYLYGGNDGSLEFKTQVEQWSQICDKIVIWDYVVNFANLLMPFPNFAVQVNNQKFYEDNGVIGIFHQASREVGGENACMRAYILSHLMWEGSKYNIEEGIAKYVKAYYGDASKEIIDILNTFAAGLNVSEMNLGMYDGLAPHYYGYLSQENILSSIAKVRMAENKLDGDEKYIARLDGIKTSLYYAMTLLPDITDEQRQSALNSLNELCDKHKITMVSEWGSLKDYNYADMQNMVEDNIKRTKAPDKGHIFIVLGIIIVLIAMLSVVFIAIKKKKNNQK